MSYLEEHNGVLHLKGDILTKLDHLRLEKARVDKEYKALTQNIINELKNDYKQGTRINDYNFVVKGGTYSLEFSVDKLLELYPDIYDKCLVPKEDTISYSLTYAKREKKDNA